MSPAAVRRGGGRRGPSESPVPEPVRRLRIPRALIAFALVLVVVGSGLIAALPAPARPIAPVHRVGAVSAEGASLMREATGSLARGQGPASGSAFSCSAPGTGWCGPTAGPRPLGSPKGSWVNLTNLSSGPSDREMEMLTYDAADGYVLLFGGGQFRNGIDDGQTWTFSAGVWTQLSPSTSPGARMGGAMTYDAADGYVVMFGGLDVAGGGFLGDTWEYSAGTWTQLSPSSSPTARWGMGMAYDAVDKYVLLFGGEAGFGSYQSDTWEFSAGSWTQLSPTPHPSVRGDVVMGYDPADHEVVLAGGEAGSANINETWNYSNGNWTNLTGSLSLLPPAVTNTAFAYDPDYGAMVLLDYQVTGANPTYLFSKHTWSHLTTSTWPPPVTRGRSAYDVADGFLVAFAGQPTSSGYPNFPVWNYTWVLAPSPLLAHLTVAPTVVDTGSLVRIGTVVIPANSGDTIAYAGLPPGCSSANLSSFTCAPTLTGTYSVNATITPPGGAKAVTTANVTLSVFAAPVVGGLSAAPAPVTQGRPLNLSTFGASGTTPLTFAYSGTPPGCPSVNRSWLACLPTSSGLYNVTVTVSDPRHGSASVWLLVTVNAAVSLAQFTVRPGPDIDVNESVTLSANRSGGTGSLSYAYFGLPPGCASVDRPNLTCRPSSPGLYPVRLHANDSQGSSANATLELAIAPDPVVGPVVATPSALDLGSAVTLSANVTGGTMPESVNWSGLPTGCQSGGGLSFQCVPRVTGTFTAVVTVTDAAGLVVRGSGNFSVDPLPRVSAVLYPSGGWDVGRTFGIAVQATGGAGGLTYAFQFSGATRSCSPGATPNVTTCVGLQAGALTFKVVVADVLGASASFTGVVGIHALPTIDAFSSAPGEVNVGQPVNFSFTAAGGTGTLVPRLAGFSADCLLSSPPGFDCQTTVAGTFNVTLTVTDAAGAQANASTLVVVLAPTPTAPAGSAFALSGLDLALLAVVAVAVAAVVGFALRGRRPPPRPPGPEPPPEGLTSPP